MKTFLRCFRLRIQQFEPTMASSNDHSIDRSSLHHTQCSNFHFVQNRSLKSYLEPVPNSRFLFPGPSFHVDLAALDSLHPVHYSRRLLIFHCTSQAQREAQLAALKAGLQALVQHCPILGGLIVPLTSDDQQQWRTINPGEGLELVVQDLRLLLPSMSELEATHFPPRDLPFELLMPVSPLLANSFEGPFGACKVQFSVIEGGTIITFAMSHSVADGSATNELLRVLAEETRLAQLSLRVGEKTMPFLGLDRSIMLEMTSSLPFNISDHPAYIAKLPPPSSSSKNHPFSASDPEIPILLSIPPDKLALLKADATTPGGLQISTHDAVTALIWRSVLLTRSHRTSLTPSLLTSTTRIFLPSDARRHLNLPADYIGNAVYQLTASLPLSTLLAPNGLQVAAQAVRSAITAVQSELVKSYVEETQKRWVEWLESAFIDGGLDSMCVVMGTDWSSGALYEFDWGENFGRMVKYRFPKGAGGGNAILPKLVDGGAEVIISIMEGEVEALRSEEGGFMKYLKD